MIKLTKSIVIALTICLIAAITPTNAEQGTQGASFPDVSTEHWASTAVSWGVEKKVLDGYTDGTFAPENSVTEAEFLKIIISSYDATLPSKGTNWFDKYYSYAKDKNWFVKGLLNKSAVDKPILRKNVAIILSAALGAYYSDDSAASTEAAITDLYNKQLSNGKTDKTIEGFVPNDSLTRAEAVQFVYNFVNKSGLTSLKTSISNADWAALDKVTFADKKGVLGKHELFAKQYGLQVKTYEEAGTTFINFVSSNQASTQTTNVPFLFSSSYKIDTDGMLSWDVVTNLDVADPAVAYELLARMFSYDTSLNEYLNQKLILSVRARGYKIEGRLRAEFGKFQVIARYDKDTNKYYISSKLSK